MKSLRLLITFYKLFAVTSLIITLACLSIMYAHGIITFTVLFWFKMITLGLIFLYIHRFKPDAYYYYKNLGLTKKHLWISTLTFDMFLFLALIIITIKLR